VSALAQRIELRGVPTAVIGTVRLHMEKVPPPRGLWTPFQLGRPLGEPDDKRFQSRVILQALRLFERTDGPVILEEFPDDPPGWLDVPDWLPPFSLSSRDIPADAEAWLTGLSEEMAEVAPHWVKARQRFGRSTVGISALAPEDWPKFLAAFLDGKLLSGPPPHHFAPALALRFTIDDLKAYYSEAVQSNAGAPASRQVDAWFLHETLAGRLLRALRVMALASDNNALKTVGGRFFVPAAWVVE
jgi:hypothetical protein